MPKDDQQRMREAVFAAAFVAELRESAQPASVAAESAFRNAREAADCFDHAYESEGNDDG